VTRVARTAPTWSARLGKSATSSPISCGKYSALIHSRSAKVGSQENTTTRRATRRSSSIPARQSVQWCRVSTAIAASKLSSSNGSVSAGAWTAGAASGGRWAIITPDGSTAVTARSGGS
jgi:hypothetical protein